MVATFVSHIWKIKYKKDWGQDFFEFEDPKNNISDDINEAFLVTQIMMMVMAMGMIFLAWHALGELGGGWIHQNQGKVTCESKTSFMAW